MRGNRHRYIEDIEDYRAFEAAVIADYDAQTAVERELVLRLASLLWRLRRATAIETDLLRIQAEILRERRDQTQHCRSPYPFVLSKPHFAIYPPMLERQRTGRPSSYAHPSHQPRHLVARFSALLPAARQSRHWRLRAARPL